VGLTVVVFVAVSLVWPGRNTTEGSTTKGAEFTKE
jgi:hypothetical protein